MSDEILADGLDESAQALLAAVVAISTDLDLHSVLSRIVVSACELTGAQYGALGVIGASGDLDEFVTWGVDSAARRRIGEPPHGRGILRLVIDDPTPLRLEDLTRHPHSYGFPANHPPMRSFLGVPVRIRGTVFGNLYLTEKAGGVQFTATDEHLVGALASAAGFVIENARAYQLSERRRQWLEASAELNEELQPPISWESALTKFTNAARALSGAAATAVLQVPPAGPEMVTCDGPAADRIPELVPQLEPAIARAVQAESVEMVSIDSTEVLVVPLRAHLSVPSVVVAAFEGGPRTRDIEERELLGSFADQAALALDRAQALADRAELAVVSDRDRIARDLHDVVIQRLFATGLQLQGMQGMVVNPEVGSRLEKAVEELDQTIRDIRTTIFELQQPHSVGLRSGINGLAKDYARVLGFAPRVILRGPVDTAVPEEAGEHLLAVVREALSNVARHAMADECTVELEVGGQQLSLTVTDNGTGLPSDRHESGLRNARRRAGLLGGTLELRSGEPSGTVFAWAAPIDRATLAD